MRRLLVLLVILALAGCTSAVERRLSPLQNPAIPGDANRDLVAYQARQRAMADCAWAGFKPEIITPYLERHPTSEAAVEAYLRDCLAEKGWR